MLLKTRNNHFALVFVFSKLLGENVHQEKYAKKKKVLYFNQKCFNLIKEGTKGQLRLVHWLTSLFPEKLLECQHKLGCLVF